MYSYIYGAARAFMNSLIISLVVLFVCAVGHRAPVRVRTGPLGGPRGAATPTALELVSTRRRSGHVAVGRSGARSNASARAQLHRALPLFTRQHVRLPATRHPGTREDPARSEPQDGRSAARTVCVLHAVRTAELAGDTAEREHVQVEAQTGLFAGLDGPARQIDFGLFRRRAGQHGRIRFGAFRGSGVRGKRASGM